MIATHRVYMAVPEAMLGAAIALACAVGPGGVQEAGSFVVRLQTPDGVPWRGMNTAADVNLLHALNVGLAGAPELAAAVLWLTVDAHGVCIAATWPSVQGNSLTWQQFLDAAHLSVTSPV